MQLTRGNWIIHVHLETAMKLAAVSAAEDDDDDDIIAWCSYNPDLTSDPYGEEGCIWSFNYFFYNRKLKRIVFFTCRATRWDTTTRFLGLSNTSMLSTPFVHILLVPTVLALQLWQSETLFLLVCECVPALPLSQDPLFLEAFPTHLVPFPLLLRFG